MLPDDSLLCLTTGWYHFENDAFSEDKGIEPDYIPPGELDDERETCSMHMGPSPSLLEYIHLIRLRDDIYTDHTAFILYLPIIRICR
ncbi:MAG: hypothetical protein G01um101466_439 [Parcubacteria group bacterium Gr01-1014_66]|nr:MAG: hypothetical protein G01um101466_439 [Parcubacteria group bacterium Gr01-1014_66]